MNPNFQDKVQSTPYDPLKINADDINSLKYSVISKIDKAELDEEIAARKVGDIAITNATDAKLSFKASTSALNDEANLRQISDAALQSSINAKANSIDLNNEITERKDSFNKLSSTFNNTVDKTALAKEASLRIDGDATLQYNIDGKVSQTAFNNEVALRISGDLDVKNLIGNVSVGVGSASPTDSPVPSIKTYNVSTVGTYTNFGGTVVTNEDITSGLVQLRQSITGTWSKVITPIALGNYTTRDLFNPVKNYVDPLQELLNTVSKEGISFTDIAGFITGEVSEAGILRWVNTYFKNANIDTATLVKLIISNVEITKTDTKNFIITDDKGFIGFDIDQQKSGGSVTTIAKVFKVPSDIVHILENGQSLSLGEGSQAVSKYIPLTDALKYNNQGSSNSGGTTFKNLLEDNVYETPCYGLAKMTIDSLTKDGFKFPTSDTKLFLSTPGQGGQPFSAFLEGTANFNKMLTQVTDGKNFSIALGKTYKVALMTWTQGESDKARTRVQYLADLVAYYEQYNRRIKENTGQKESIPMLHYQVSSSDNVEVAMAYYNASSLYPDKFMLACPMYMWDYNATDKVHLLNGLQYKRYGAYLGYATKKIVFEGVQWKPLRPIDFYFQGTIIQLQYHVLSGSLTFDTSLVTDPGNYGFRLYDASGTQVTISSVVITRYDTIKITAAVAITAGFKITYAIKNGTVNESGRTIGQRGCVRDQQGNTVIFDEEGSPFPLHNYSVMFEYTF